MKAFQFVEWQQPGQLRDVPVPEPGPGEVLVKVGGAGACHSDLHLLEAPAGTQAFTLPFTLGHENAGWVEKMGPGATGFAPGDPVIVYGPWGCGLCMNCRQGHGELLPDPGKAQSRRPRRHRRRHGRVPPRPVDALSDPAGRPGSPRGGAADRRRADQLSRREAIGASARARLDRGRHRGGRSRADGHPGAQGAGFGDNRCRGGHFGRQAEDRQDIGADEALVSGDDAVTRIKDITKGQGAELVLDLVGVDPTLTMAAQVARVLGHLTIVGLGNAALPVNFSQPAARMLCRVAVLGLHPRTDRGHQPRPDRQDQDARRTLHARRCGARLRPVARRQDPGTRRHHAERLTARVD